MNHRENLLALVALMMLIPSQQALANYFTVGGVHQVRINKADGVQVKRRNEENTGFEFSNYLTPGDILNTKRVCFNRRDNCHFVALDSKGQSVLIPPGAGISVNPTNIDVPLSMLTPIPDHQLEPITRGRQTAFNRINTVNVDGRNRLVNTTSRSSRPNVAIGSAVRTTTPTYTNNRYYNPTYTSRYRIGSTPVTTGRYYNNNQINMPLRGATGDILGYQAVSRDRMTVDIETCRANFGRPDGANFVGDVEAALYGVQMTPENLDFLMDRLNTMGVRGGMLETLGSSQLALDDIGNFHRCSEIPEFAGSPDGHTYLYAHLFTQISQNATSLQERGYQPLAFDNLQPAERIDCALLIANENSIESRPFRRDTLYAGENSIFDTLYLDPSSTRAQTAIDQAGAQMCNDPNSFIAIAQQYSDARQANFRTSRSLRGGVL